MTRLLTRVSARGRILGALILLLLVGCASPIEESSPTAAPLEPPDRFAAEVAAFQRQGQESPSAPGVVVFAGSSSIRMWSSLEADMAPLPVLNRGFGGSEMSDLLRHLEALVTRHDARAIVVYEGDNDLRAGSPKSPEAVAAEFRELVARVRAARGEIPVHFISIKPSPSRWERWPLMSRANALVRAACSEDPTLTYLDVASPMLTSEGLPRRELFLDDELHLNAAGYAVWAAVIRPALGQVDAVDAAPMR